MKDIWNEVRNLWRAHPIFWSAVIVLLIVVLVKS